MPRSEVRFRVLAALVACLALSSLGIEAQERRDLEKLERQIESGRKQRNTLQKQQQSIEQDLARLRADLIRAARSAQEHEALLNKLEAKIPELEKEAASRATQLEARRRQMTGTLAALERLSRNPPHALLLSGGTPVEVVRSVLLLRAAVPQLQSRAEALRGELEKIASIQDELDQRRRQIRQAGKELELERERLNVLMKHKGTLRRRTAEESRRVDERLASLDRKARNLRDLFSQVEEHNRRKREAPQPAAPKPELRPEAALPDSSVRPEGLRTADPVQGSMTLPARGRLVEGFGTSTTAGNVAKGATFETRAGAQVVAPYDGKVAFAGAFRGYGQILIMEHGDAYHTLLAGLKRVDVGVGQWLLAGEPVGIMGSQEAGPRLYVELRRKGLPVNPLPWFTAANEKVRG